MAHSIENKETVENLIKLGKAYVIATFSIASLSLFFRFWDYDFFRKISFNQEIVINPFSAFSFILLSLGIWLVRDEKSSERQKLSSNLICILILLIGLSKIMETAFEIPFTLDELFFIDQIQQGEKSDWTENIHLMSPVTGFVLCLVSASVLFINNASSIYYKTAQFLDYLAALTGLLSIYAYIYDIENLYRQFRFSPISVHSAICTVLISTGILFLRPHKGSMATVIGQNSIQIVLLRFLSFFIPLILGLFKIEGTERNWFGKEFGTALYATATFAISMTLLGWRSHIQKRLKKVRYKTEKRIRDDRKRLKRIMEVSPTTISIVDLNSDRLVFVNKSSRDLFRVNGKSLKNVEFPEVVDKLIFEKDKKKVLENYKKFKDTEKDFQSELTFRMRDKKNNVVWALSRASVFKYHKKNIKEVIFNSLNISRQVKLEAELEKKNEEIEEKNLELEKINKRLKELHENLEDEVEKVIDNLEESRRACKDFFENSFEGIMRYGLKDIDGISLERPLEEQIELIAKHAYIAEANKKLAKIHGYSDPEELTGSPITEYLKMEKEEKLKIIKNFIEGDYRLDDHPTFHSDKNGNQIRLRTNVTGIIGNNKLLGAWATQRIYEDEKDSNRKDQN